MAAKYDKGLPERGPEQAAFVMPRRVGERVDLEVEYISKHHKLGHCVTACPPDSTVGIDNQPLLAERDLVAIASSSNFHGVLILRYWSPRSSHVTAVISSLPILLRWNSSVYLYDA